MKKLIMLSLAIILILSGCLEKATDDRENITNTNVVNSSAINKTDLTNSIIGKWNSDNESIEFLKEGKMIISRKDENLTGSYKFVGEDQIMINVENLGTEIVWKIVNISDEESIIFTGKYDIKFKRNKLSISDTGIDENIRTSWCIPGDTITIDKGDFVIQGITTYTDDNNKIYKDVCRAEKTIQGGSSVIYFNEGYINKDNNQFFAMKSSSKGSNANAEASAHVKVGN